MPNTNGSPQVSIAEPADIPAWLVLAAEVEDLFGPLVSDPGFHRALEHNIECQTAFCVRAGSGYPGELLSGGILFSPRHAPQYHIGWLAVSAAWRRRGVGRALVEHVFKLVVPPADLEVITFGNDIPQGAPARRFYVNLGFVATEAVPYGADNSSREVFRRVFV